MSKALLASALWYASIGWSVFPCVPGGKEPLTARGFYDSSTDEKQIRQWWRENPKANIGVASGMSGLVVVDVDTKNDGEATYEFLREQLGAEVFDTVTALTPSGGTHLVYATDGTVVKSGAHVLGQGIDIRAEGGYIVVAPSVVNGNEYRWEVGYSPKDRKPSIWPDELASKIVAKTFARPLEDSKKIGSGDRNHTLTSLAGSMRRRGFGFDEIVGALQVTNFKRCDPALPIVDVERIAKSVCRYSPEEIIGKDLTPVQVDVEVRSIAEVFADIHNRVDNRGPALPFGVKKLDAELGGMHPGMVTVLGARTGVGKTAAGEHIILSAAKVGRVVALSLELEDTRLVERIAARHERYGVREYREMGRPMEDTSWLDELDLHVVSKSRRVDIATIEAVVKQHHPRLLMIDHARHIRGWLPRPGDKTRADLAPAEIMESLSCMATEYGMHVLLLSQVVRQADGSRPSLSELRDSGSVEENADNVIFLHRPFQFGDEDGGEDDTMEFCVWKAREAGTFIAHTKWDGGRMRVSDVPADAFEAIKYERCCAGGDKKRKGRAA